MIFYLLQGATLGISATVSPGPFQAFLLAQTMKNGWLRTMPVTLAPILSDIPIVTMILLMLNQTPVQFIQVLRLLGGLFLLYLAWGTYRSLHSEVAAAEEPPNDLLPSFGKGMLMNALSPGPYFFWSVLAGPVVLDAWRQSPIEGISFVVGFYTMLVGGFALFVILFATASHLGPKVNIGLRIVSLAALTLFGLYQLWVGTIALLQG
jgi:threonine/homoserine/homoserine lactone efflux protein